MITLVTEADASDIDDTHDNDDDVGVVTGLIKLNTTTGRHGDCGVVSVGKEAHNTLHDHCMTISILFVLDTSLDNSSKRKCQNILINILICKPRHSSVQLKNVE